ncbi:MAG: pyridoxal phosphate enzyme YggS family [Actinomycetia bacterium]|nr:pyridoxal phosphate enzyme YggS family [Actinomycetes bacterium]
MTQDFSNEDVNERSNDIGVRLHNVHERIRAAATRAERDPAGITLVAVSKTVDAERIAAAARAGQRVFGENRAQELAAHADAIDGDVEWHFIGRLQRNKVRSIARNVALWQSVDRDELVPELAHRAPGARVLVQVNVGDEPQKGGCTPAATAQLVDTARTAGLRVEGLMTVPPAATDPRPFFAQLRDLGGQLGLPELSMGMSSDFEAAVAEGATIVRVGSAIFGPRPAAADTRR